MPASPPPVTSLPRGHVFAPARVDLPADRVRAYVQATEDASAYAGEGYVPPLAVAALALGRLLEQCALPSGSLHTGQEVEFHAPVRPGAALIMTGEITQRSERAGMVISVIEFAVGSDDGPVVTGKTTVMAPREPAA